jgi:peptidoglycan/LPS O-acetylase OafA/YrhL
MVPQREYLACRRDAAVISQAILHRQMTDGSVQVKNNTKDGQRMQVDASAVGRAAPAAAAGEIRSLTGLRGIAASFVMLYHFTATTVAAGPLSTFVRKGYIWVDLFFVLSGFIMALSFANTFASRADSSWRTYWMFLSRRLARVYPLYLLVTTESAIVAVGVAEHGPRRGSFDLTVAANVTMVQAWGIARSLEGAAWSISTEWAAYLLFPGLLALTLCRSRRVAFASGLVCIVAVALLAASPGLRFDDQSRMGPLDIYSSSTIAPLIRCLAEFSLGLLSYRYFRATETRRDSRIQHARWAAATSLVIVLAMMLPNTDVLIVALFPLLITMLAFQTGWVAFVLSSRLPVWLGNVSYSIYLLHGKFVHLVDWGGDALVGRGGHSASVFIAIMLVMLCATIVHHLIERPFRILVRQALEHPRKLLRRQRDERPDLEQRPRRPRFWQKRLSPALERDTEQPDPGAQSAAET